MAFSSNFGYGNFDQPPFLISGRGVLRDSVLVLTMNILKGLNPKPEDSPPPRPLSEISDAFIF